MTYNNFAFRSVATSSAVVSSQPFTVSSAAAGYARQKSSKYSNEVPSRVPLQPPSSRRQNESRSHAKRMRNRSLETVLDDKADSSPSRSTYSGGSGSRHHPNASSSSASRRHENYSRSLERPSKPSSRRPSDRWLLKNVLLKIELKCIFPLSFLFYFHMHDRNQGPRVLVFR